MQFKKDHPVIFNSQCQKIKQILRLRKHKHDCFDYQYLNKTVQQKQYQMAQTQFHLVRVTVRISSAHISVRFPCSLHFQFKCNSVVYESTQSYQLKDGKCQCDNIMTIEVQLEVLKEKQKYHSTNGSISVILTSSNGKVPAGSVTFPIVDNGQLVQKQQVQSKKIDKCPDKLSKLNFKYKAQVISSHKRVKNSYLENSRSSNKIGISSALKYNNSEYSLQKDSLSLNINSDRLNYKSQSHTRLLSPRYQNKAVYKYAKEPAQVPLSSNLQRKQINQLSSLQSRIQGQQSSPLNELNQENQHMSQYQPKGNFKSEEVANYKAERQNLMQQMYKLRQNYKNLQRKQKQYSKKIVELSQQNEKLKSKLLMSETNNNKSRQAVQQKQRKIQKVEEQIKKLSQQVEQLKKSNALQQKRSDYKQATLNEQLKKMSQKYQQSENQRNKTMMQMNKMLIQFQNKQKKNQLQYKQKQIAIIEEKNKLNKRIQQLKAQVKAVQQQKSQLKVQMQDLKSNNMSIYTNNNNIANQLSQLSTKYEHMVSLNKKNEQNYLQMKSQYNELEAENERLVGISKKYAQISVQYNKAKDMQIRMNKKIQSLTNSLKQMETSLKESSNSKQNIAVKNAQLTKQLITVKKTLQSKQSEINNLQKNLNDQKIKKEQLRAKFDKESNVALEAKKKIQEQLVYQKNNKEYIHNLYYQLQSQFQQTQQKYKAEQAKVSLKCEQVQNITDQLVNFKQVVRQLQAFNKQLGEKSKINQKQLKQSQQTVRKRIIEQRLGSENNGVQNRQDLSNKAIDGQQQINLDTVMSQLKRNVERLQRQKIQLQNIKQYEKKQLQDQIRVRQNRQQQVTRQNEKIKNQIQNLHNTKRSLQAKIKSLEQQNNQMFSGLQSQNKYVNEMSLQNNQKSNLIKQLELQCSNSKHQINNLAIQNRKLKQQVQVSHRQHQKYKIEMVNSFEKFVNEFCKQLTNIGNGNGQKNTKIVQQYTLINFPDESITNLQRKIFQKRTQIYLKWMQSLKKIEQTAEQSTKQIAKTKQSFAYIQKRIESSIEQQKIKIKQLLNVGQNERNELTQKLIVLQQRVLDKHEETDKLLMQIQSHLDEIGQLKRVNHLLSIRCVELQMEYNILVNKQGSAVSSGININNNISNEHIVMNGNSKQELISNSNKN